MRFWWRRPPYTHVYRLTAPQRILTLVGLRWLRVTASRSSVSDRFEHTANPDRMAEALAIEYGIRLQVGSYSASWMVRKQHSLRRWETVAKASSTFALAVPSEEAPRP